MLWLLLPACSSAAPDDPEWVASTFVEAMCDADYGEAHELVDASGDDGAPTEDEFLEVMERARHPLGPARRGGCRIHDDPQFEDAGGSQGVVRVWLVNETGDGAVRHEVQVMERDGRWRVDFTRMFPDYLLQQAPGSPLGEAERLIGAGT